MPHFDFKDGGTVAQYNLARILDELGQNVRIYSHTGILIQNNILISFPSLRISKT